ncbi:hypothetical protein FY036_15785 [Mesorhizobium microcysteis]|uniref:ParB-like N-terminal domain-containing protein n=1 Tax=Neoaquamicrobium microcysteis TaxID=2682781 RepID=A0A5D4GPW6_9HYPH|nr:ParB/RepB/Spo0J family partition protein [Mesorhizobium microcysteis]TYR30911.1 hypothetical protein FY036_15785 [Mesorhizobium microcysteis]
MAFLNKETVKRRKQFGRTEMFPPEGVRVGDRLREVGDVTSLASSMSVVGLENPIAVRMVKEGDSGYFQLVAGARRLAAAKSLGWDAIECHVYVNMTDDEAEALEIVENLERQDLTAAERKKWVKALAAAYGRMDAAVSGQDDPKLSSRGRKGEGRPKGVGAKVAEATGMSKRQINRILAEDKKPAKDDTPPTLPGHTSSKSRPPANEVEAAGLVTEGNTEEGHEEGTEAPNVTRFGEAKRKLEEAKRGSPLIARADHRDALFTAMMDACDKGGVPLSTKVGKTCAEAALRYFETVMRTPATEPDLADMESVADGKSTQTVG